jgi:hypothetical protein
MQPVQKKGNASSAAVLITGVPVVAVDRVVIYEELKGDLYGRRQGCSGPKGHLVAKMRSIHRQGVSGERLLPCLPLALDVVEVRTPERGPKLQLPRQAACLVDEVLRDVPLVLTTEDLGQMEQPGGCGGGEDERSSPLDDQTKLATDPLGRT